MSLYGSVDVFFMWLKCGKNYSDFIVDSPNPFILQLCRLSVFFVFILYSAAIFQS